MKSIKKAIYNNMFVGMLIVETTDDNITKKFTSESRGKVISIVDPSDKLTITISEVIKVGDYVICPSLSLTKKYIVKEETLEDTTFKISLPNSNITHAVTVYDITRRDIRDLNKICYARRAGGNCDPSDLMVVDKETIYGYDCKDRGVIRFIPYQDAVGYNAQKRFTFPRIRLWDRVTVTGANKYEKLMQTGYVTMIKDEVYTIILENTGERIHNLSMYDIDLINKDSAKNKDIVKSLLNINMRGKKTKIVKNLSLEEKYNDYKKSKKKNEIIVV